jgi:A/G-specific adenine glycosylase
VLMPIVVNDRGEVLLQKRPPVGIWGGLWSLPECVDEVALSHWYQGKGIAQDGAQVLEPIRHTFTHFHLLIQPVYSVLKHEQSVADSGTDTWCSVKQLNKLGLPSPVRRILESVI